LTGTKRINRDVYIHHGSVGIGRMNWHILIELSCGKVRCTATVSCFLDYRYTYQEYQVDSKKFYIASVDICLNSLRGLSSLLPLFSLLNKLYFIIRRLELAILGL